MAARFDPARFVEKRGLVVTRELAEAIAGAPIRGSWWSHAKGKSIFRALSALADRDDVKFFKLIGGKVTIAHRRVWPALVRLADELGEAALDEIRQEHTATGAHRNLVEPWPAWLPGGLTTLPPDQARAALGPLADLVTSSSQAGTARRRGARAPARRRASARAKR